MWRHLSRRELFHATILALAGVGLLVSSPSQPKAAAPPGPFTLPDLPYAKDALTPHISAETLHYHHDKHHAAYVNKLNELVHGTKYETMSLEEIVKTAGEGPVFNNAAQHWNHSFYWKCMSPHGGGEPEGAFADRIRKHFGDFASLKKQFGEAAMGQFGSGWAWLTKKADGSLAIEKTSNADTPIARGERTP